VFCRTSLSIRQIHVAVPTRVVLLVSARTEDHDSLASIVHARSGSAGSMDGPREDTQKSDTARSPEIPVVDLAKTRTDGDWKFMLAGFNGLWRGGRA